LLEVVLLPCMVGVCFAIYYVLPNGRVPARPVISAALVAGLVMEAGKFVYLATLPLFNFREVYGPFALSVTLLFWAFLGALVLLSGAHLSARVHSREPFGGRSTPTKRAATDFSASPSKAQDSSAAVIDLDESKHESQAGALEPPQNT